MPFADDSFDVVVANNYNGDSQDMLKETIRVLRTGGGRLGFSFSDKHMASLCHHMCKQFGLEVGKLMSLKTERGEEMGTWVFLGVKR